MSDKIDAPPGPPKKTLDAGKDFIAPIDENAPPPRHVFRWDLDKTYLKTDFDSFKGLWKSAFEKAEDKQAMPGAAALLRAFRKLDGARVTFISGSPQQMRKTLTRKLALDGVEFDEFILKHNLRNLLRGRFRAVKEQVGYKLPALLAGRSRCVAATGETCFGDDAEADAFVYSLFADLLSGGVDVNLLEQILERARVYPDDAARTLELARGLERADAVGRIFIHLERHSPTARFDRYGARLVPIYNYFQAGLVLVEDGLFPVEVAAAIAAEMVDKFEYTSLALRNSVEDLVRRGRIRPATVARLAAACSGSLAELASRLLYINVPPGAPPLAAPIDYLAAFDDDARARDKKK